MKKVLLTNNNENSENGTPPSKNSNLKTEHC